MFERIAFAVALLCAGAAEAQEGDAVVANPPVNAFFSCVEHFAGQFAQMGDALGTDCIVQKLVDVRGRTWLRAYDNDGSLNEDWYGWREPLLSPCTCKVADVHVNPVENPPGVVGVRAASSIVFLRDDGVYFVLAHVREIAVRIGDEVVAGQPVAMIGNNGFARNPHVHVAAWKNDRPLQIRWDQARIRPSPEVLLGRR